MTVTTNNSEFTGDPKFAKLAFNYVKHYRINSLKKTDFLGVKVSMETLQLILKYNALASEIRVSLDTDLKLIEKAAENGKDKR